MRNLENIFHIALSWDDAITATYITGLHIVPFAPVLYFGRQK